MKNKQTKKGKNRVVQVCAPMLHRGVEEAEQFGKTEGSKGGETATLTLSEHFGKRPVALVFGSYT